MPKRVGRPIWYLRARWGGTQRSDLVISLQKRESFIPLEVLPLRHLRLLWISLAILAATLVPVYGQAVNGTLLGTITDATGAIVPNAKVTITETNTGISRSAETNRAGFYTFPNLDPG